MYSYANSDDGSISNDIKQVLNKWKTDFSSLLNNKNTNNNNTNDNATENISFNALYANNVDLDTNISISEV